MVQLALQHQGCIKNTALNLSLVEKTLQCISSAKRPKITKVETLSSNPGVVYKVTWPLMYAH